MEMSGKRIETSGDKGSMQKRIETRRSIRKRVETDMNYAFNDIKRNRKYSTDKNIENRVDETNKKRQKRGRNKLEYKYINE